MTSSLAESAAQYSYNLPRTLGPSILNLEFRKKTVENVVKSKLLKSRAWRPGGKLLPPLESCWVAIKSCSSTHSHFPFFIGPSPGFAFAFALAERAGTLELELPAAGVC